VDTQPVLAKEVSITVDAL